MRHCGPTLEKARSLGTGSSYTFLRIGRRTVSAFGIGFFVALLRPFFRTEYHEHRYTSCLATNVLKTRERKDKCNTVRNTQDGCLSAVMTICTACTVVDLRRHAACYISVTAVAL